MRIDWAVTCRYAESDGNIGTIVGAGIDVLYVAALPTQVAVMLAVRLALVPEEAFDAGQEHEVTCHVLDPQGDAVRAADGSLAEPLSLKFSAPPGAQQLVPGWLVTPLFAFQVVWLAQSSGTYSIETRTDEGENLSPVHVLLPPQP